MFDVILHINIEMSVGLLVLLWLENVLTLTFDCVI